MEVVEQSTEEFKMLLKYIINSSSDYKKRVVNIYKIQRKGEPERIS